MEMRVRHGLAGCCAVIGPDVEIRYPTASHEKGADASHQHVEFRLAGRWEIVDAPHVPVRHDQGVAFRYPVGIQEREGGVGGA